MARRKRTRGWSPELEDEARRAIATETMHGSAYVRGRLLSGKVKVVGGRSLFLADDGTRWRSWAAYRQHAHGSQKEMALLRQHRRESEG
jgi:hypothetical protein